MNQLNFLGGLMACCVNAETVKHLLGLFKEHGNLMERLKLRIDVESYSQLLKFCQNYEISNKELNLIRKLLLHFSKLWSSIRDEIQEKVIESSYMLSIDSCIADFNNFTNVFIPLGTCLDGLLKVIIQNYVYLKNVMKYFLNFCEDVAAWDKIDILKVVGKALPSNFHALITYIDSNVFDMDKKHKPNSENFNKSIVLLAKKADLRLVNFVHAGTTRDYRVEASGLKAGIGRTLSHNSQIEDADMTNDNNGIERIEEESRLLENQENENKQDVQEQDTNDNHHTGHSKYLKAEENGSKSFCLKETEKRIM
uniref:FANCI solenoid 4 domain-containing protein n=1 Tax=Glossina pallidipes TaxID=7398 RepID=A0A1A9Z292_GLOPL